MWEYRGQRRPAFAEEPGPGQESVWGYPRPPVVRPQPGDFYGGWISAQIAGPVKGAPGTEHW